MNANPKDASPKTTIKSEDIQRELEHIFPVLSRKCEGAVRRHPAAFPALYLTLLRLAKVSREKCVALGMPETALKQLEAFVPGTPPPRRSLIQLFTR